MKTNKARTVNYACRFTRFYLKRIKRRSQVFIQMFNGKLFGFQSSCFQQKQILCFQRSSFPAKLCFKFIITRKSSN